MPNKTAPRALVADLDLALARYGRDALRAAFEIVMAEPPASPRKKKVEWDNFALLVTYLEIGTVRRMQPKRRRSVPATCKDILKKREFRISADGAHAAEVPTLHRRFYEAKTWLVKLPKVEQDGYEAAITASLASRTAEIVRKRSS
jgi:hypothetical protein